MKICCPNCHTVRELPHEDKFSCNFECSCGHTFPADDDTILEEYSEIDLPLPEKIAGCPIESLIGMGGMGKVCKGIHKDLHVPVAVKLLRQELIQQAAAGEKFLATSQLCARLDSPYIVKVYECGIEERGPYLIMEYLEGGTALDLLEQSGVLSPQRCAAIAMDVCAGLEKANELGVVHRDLKPDNIMFAADGSVRIMDLGLAFLRDEARTMPDMNVIRRAAGKTAFAHTLGTAHYMPPEQILDPSACDARSDIYALGITMYQLVTGKLPFDGEDHEKVRYMQIHQQPPAPSSLVKDLPPDLEKIILRAMEKEPSDRYESAGSMIADLDAFLHNRVLPSSFRTVSPDAAIPSPLPALPSLPLWQEKMVRFVEENLPATFRETHKELWEYLSTTPQLHLLRLLAELGIVILLAIVSAWFWS